MKNHLEELKLGGRPMTKLELANKEIDRLNNIINELNAKLNQYEEREEMQYLIKDEERFNYSMSDQVDY